MTTPSLGKITHRPVAKKDSDFNVNQYSFNDAAFQGDNDGTDNLIYVGWAKTGTPTTAPFWQIRKLSYDANGNVLTITWPLNASHAPSSDFEFIWDNRAALTYA